VAPIKIHDVIFFLCISSFVQAEIEERVQWDSRLYDDHPLVGKIWSSEFNNFLSTEQVENAMLGAKYLILGEKHDNPDHHILQRSIIEHLIANNNLSLLAFEMMDPDSQKRLDDIQSESLEDLLAIQEYLDWDTEGWEWSYYGPLIRSAYESAVPMVGANISSSKMMELYGLSALPPEIDILEQSIKQQLNLDIDESHCGLLPESQFPAMVRVQQGRDYSMSQSLGPVDNEGTKVLIARNYHARKDLGVPNYLLENNPGLTSEEIISLSLMEVDPSETEPEMYLQQHDEIAAYDYIWFTPVISEVDYCASLRQ
jgi:uncharacterized iron-regulated protein